MGYNNKNRKHSGSGKYWQEYKKRSIIKTFVKLYEEQSGELFHTNLQSLPIESFPALELQCITIIQKARKLLGIQNIESDVRKNAQRAKDRLLSRLDDLRTVYIDRLNKTHGYTIDPKTLVEGKENQRLDRRIEDHVFKQVISQIIPEHPKDEFPLARTLQRHFVIHYGDTNTGKTYHALKALKKAETGVYLAPLRLLALEVFQNLNEDGIPCILTTGEEDIVVDGARHISSTIEKLDVHTRYEVAVIDEAQMLSDSQRGHAWVKAILGVVCAQVHICCSPNALKLVIKLIESCGDTHEQVEYLRNTELVFEPELFTFPESVSKGDALIAFSKKSVLGISSLLSQKRIKASVIYGDLPPETRRNQIRMFIDGETQVVVATDAIGMGLNLPVKRIVFMETEKFNGEDVVLLKPSEIKQISGRAGRKGIYDIGYVSSVSDREHIIESLGRRLNDLSSAYYLPLEKYILRFPFGSLEKRMIACMDARGNISYLNKTDLTQPLSLLKKIDGTPLSMEEKLSLIFIPFDAKSDALVEEWLFYIYAYIADKTGGRLSYFVETKRQNRQPAIHDELGILEHEYKSLGLYYSFCSTMKLPLDKQSVMDKKYRIAEEIHDVLRTKMKKMGKTCRECGAKLSWDFPYPICEDCFQMRRSWSV